MHSFDVESLIRRTTILENYLKTVLEPLLFNSMMEIEKMGKFIRTQQNTIKRLEGKIVKLSGNETENTEENVEEEQQVPVNPQQMMAGQQQQAGYNPMLRRQPPMTQQQQMAAQQRPSGLLGNPLVQTAIANNPLLAQQFGAGQQQQGGRDPMEVIRRMKQSVSQMPSN
jgi:hypothetical protein